MENNELILNMKNISKSFFGIQVLFDVHMQLKAGEIHCLVGENGAGKSTLIKVLCGLYKDYKGEVIIEDEPIVMTNAMRSRENGIFSVQQHRDLVPTLNAVENMFLGNYIFKKNGSLDMKAMKEKAEDYLKQFKIDINLDVPVSELKVSEQGIIAICKATLSEGKIFLIDEASAPLDNFERKILYDLLKKLRNEGKGIIYISHHLEEIFNIGDRVTVLRNGKNVWTKNTKDTSKEDLINAMTGNKKLYMRSDSKRKSIIKGNNVEPIFWFNSVYDEDLNDVNLSIQKGEVVGFAGLEGSGKQKIADIMFGLEKIKKGSVKYNGENISFSHPIKAMKSNIASIPTERKIQGLVPCRSVAENATVAALNKMKNPIISNRWVNKTTLKNVQDMSIVIAAPSQLVEFLSGGNQQKVLLAKWINTKMDVLLCVEPTEGVDVGARADIYRLLNQMADDGTTIIIFSSDIDELLTLCDRIYTMSQGRIINNYDALSVEKTQILTDILMKQEGEG